MSRDRRPVWPVGPRTMLCRCERGRAILPIWVFSGWSSSFNNIIERQTGHESETFVLYCDLQGMVRMPFGFFWVSFCRRKGRRASYTVNYNRNRRGATRKNPNVFSPTREVRRATHPAGNCDRAPRSRRARRPSIVLAGQRSRTSLGAKHENGSKLSSS